jgi:hypothetical protein
MWGSNNELMIFPIIELIHKELSKSLNTKSGSSTQGLSTTEILYQEFNNNSINNSSTLLTQLESNDYELVLEKNDPLFPNRLTSVSIVFTADLTEKVQLNRGTNGKLSSVDVTVLMRVPNNASNAINPLGMSEGDFLTYVRNKIGWTHYNNISQDPDSTQQEKDYAETRKVFYSAQNDQLRSLYMLAGDIYSLNELCSYLDNPLTMSRDDFITYVFNRWTIEKSTHTDITQDIKDGAAIQNQTIMTTYFLDVDMYTYEELVSHLYSPFAIYYDDYNYYVGAKKELSSIDPVLYPDRVIELNTLIDSTLDKYYIVSDNTLQTELDRLLALWVSYMTSGYTTKTLLKIIISLIYSGEGKLLNVKSETVKL